MENFFKITAEVLENALTYMPIASKTELAKSIAESCVEPAKTAEQNRGGEKLLALPYIKVENYTLKEILLMNTLVGFYFNAELDPEENAYDTYDYYACGNIFEQLKRFKGDEKLREKAFAIIEDFRKFKKVVDTEIFNKKMVANDGLARVIAAVQVGADPETLRNALESLKGIDPDQLKIPETEKNKEDEK